MPSAYNHFYRLHFLIPPFGLWRRHNHRSVLARLDELALPPATILEVGGGLGGLAPLVAPRFPDSSVVSVDISAEMVEAARHRTRAPNITHQLCDFRDVSGSYELILSAGSWEFFDLGVGTATVDRLLAPGGSLVINTLGPALFARLHATLYHQKYGGQIFLHAPDDLSRSLRGVGLEVRWEPVNGLEGSYTVVAHRPR